MDLLSIHEVGKRLGCSISTVRRLVADGYLAKPVRQKGAPRWLAKDVEAYLHLLGRGFWNDAAPPPQPPPGKK